MPGVLADGELLESEITEPPAGATEASETVAVVVLPPLTVEGFKVSNFSLGGFIVSVVVFDTPASVADIVATTRVPTATVFIANVAEALPAATNTVAGSVAVFELLERLTVIPKSGAAPVSVTVPADDDPPGMSVGSTDKLKRAGGVTARITCLEINAASAVMVTDFCFETVFVVTANVARV